MTDNTHTIISAEIGRIEKIDPAVTIALCYPNLYQVGMSNLGFHTAYYHFNAHEEVKAERAFFVPGVKSCTIESGRGLQSFSCIAFSVNYECDFKNILLMLASAHIPFYRKDRTDQHPFVFVGGFITFSNIQPLAPFIDFACMGESENLFSFINAALIEYCTERTIKKEDFLKRLATHEHIYVPGFNENVQQNIIQDINAYETISRIITPYTEFKKAFLVEIARGCLYSCDFCLTGHVYPRPRIRSCDTIIASCEKGLAYTDRIGLIAATPSDYPHLDELCAYLKKKKVRASFSSLRASSISDELIAFLVQSGQKTLTVAPEVGSEELRKKLHKNMSNALFISLAHRAKKHGIKKMRLYMMIGLPFEEKRHLDETVSFLKEMGSIMPIRVGTSVFVPKPKTPFAQYRVAERSLIRERFRYLKQRIGYQKNIVLRFDSYREAQEQARLAIGNENALCEVADALRIA